MTCCGCTFLVLATLSMACSLAALWLPFVVVIPDNGSGSSESNDGTTSSRALAPLIKSHVLKAAPSNDDTKSRHMKQQQLSGLPDNSAQCPFLNGPCWLGSVELTKDGISFQTDDLVQASGCNALGDPEDPGHTRFWASVAAALSGVTLLVAIGHASKGNNFGQNAAMIKFGAAGIAGMHVGACLAAIAQEAPISKCVQNTFVDILDFVPGSYTIIMISLLMTICAGALQFLNAVGMLLSWCVSCCGAPAGRDYMVVVVSAQTMNEQPLYPAQMGTLPPLPPPQQSYDPYGRPVQGSVQYAAPGYPAKY
jgi:hypothetical protein